MSFVRSRDANIAIMTALALPVLMMGAGAAVDFQRWGQQQARLQEFADALALRGAREFMLANAQPASIKSVVEAASRSDLAEQMGIGAFELAVDVDGEAATVTVDVVQPAPRALLLSRISPYGDDLAVESVAVARGGMNVCVIALEESGDGAVAAADDAVLDATPCSILSNSNSPAGIEAVDDATIRAGLICSAGGWNGASARYLPSPTTDCPVYPDPLAAREPPPVGPCDHFDYEAGYLKAQSSKKETGLVGGLVGGVTDVVEEVAEVVRVPLIEIELQPGVYCGGIAVKYNARAVFRPGVYVIKDGPLSIGKYSELRGTNVAFHLVGDDATFTFDKDAKVTMSAPKTGPLAGILFFEDRSAPAGRVHAILSEDAREFLGTFYLPKGTLQVNTQNPVADHSAYTAIVVRKLDLAGAPTLVLNADYASTDVPVPDGVGPVGSEVYLRN